MGNFDLSAIHEHGHPTILSEFSTNLGHAAAIFLAPASAPVTVTIVVGPRVPSCLRKAIAVVLNDVHFHATGLAFSLNVTIIAG